MTQELRKLAEAATVGIWKASGFDVNSKEHGWATIANTELDYDGMAENAAYIAAANPAAILALLDRVEKAEKDAERYRWLVDADMLSSPSVDMADAFSKYTGSALDAAIDAAMEASK